MAKCQLFSKAIKKSKKKLKSLLYTPLRGFSAIQDKGIMHYKGCSKIYIYLKGVKKPPKFPFKITMVPNVRRGQEISVTTFALDFFNIPMILT